jgi:bifunctional non-homologous end joining protein LigD
VQAVTPMLSKLIDAPFDGKDWLFEIKLDGYRAIGAKNRGVTLLSRNGQSFNKRYPDVVNDLEKLPGKFIVDGEIVILDSDGRSNFQLLQNYQKTKKGTIYYYLFDILSLNGKDLRSLPLIKRKEILKKLLKKAGPRLRYMDHILERGKAFFQAAKKKGLEGIMAKKIGSTYKFARSSDWLKIKAVQRQEVVIGGYTEPKGSRKKFGALLVGTYEKGKLKYCGHVGGGFNQKLLTEVYDLLQKFVTDKCPFTVKPKPNMPVTWVRPKLVCEVSFAEWTKEGNMRQPIFKGIRTDKPAKKVVREKPI